MLTKMKIKEIKKQKVKIEKCWNCNKYPISCKDYRPDDIGNVNKVLVCKYCCQLNEVWYYRVNRDKLNPKKILEG